ncbi:uncharacterized protein LOC144121149 isoform X1 [Amblyomma americanum]
MSKGTHCGWIRLKSLLPVVNEAPDGSEVLLSREDSLPEGSRRDDLSQLVASSPICSASAAVPVLQSTGNSSDDTSRASAGVSSSATAGASSTAGAGTSTKRREPQNSRHRRQGSAVEQLVAVHKGESEAAAKADCKAHKMRKIMVRLQKEANAMNVSMVQLLVKFLDNKENNDSLNKECSEQLKVIFYYSR